MKNKKAEFEMQSDRYSIHTFEISRRLTKFEFQQHKAYIYDLNVAGEKAKTYKDDKQAVYYCFAFAKHGIRISLEHASTNDYDQYFMRMIVNPRLLIDPNSDYLGILPLKKASISELKDAFFELFSHTPIESEINGYYLSRVDQCLNIICSKKKIFVS